MAKAPVIGGSVEYEFEDEDDHKDAEGATDAFHKFFELVGGSG